MTFRFLSALTQMQIAKKIPAVIVLLGALSIGLTGSFSYFKAVDTITSAAEDTLLAVTSSRKAALADYLKSISEDLLVQAENDAVIQALVDFQEGYRAFEVPEAVLQRLYITDNPHPTGKKEELDAASDGSAYSRSHARYHPWFRKLLRARDYYDIFLFDAKGNLVYTVFKELDFATNLVIGKWRDSGLGEAFRAGRDNPTRGFQAFFDFAPYAPSHGAPASFISAPILSSTGDFLGVLAFQMPISRINKIMEEASGMGRTGQSFILGTDLLMRNDARLAKESTILKQKVDTPAVRAALAGKTGLLEAVNHDGVHVATAYVPMTFKGTQFAVVSEKAMAELLEDAHVMRNTLLIIGAAILAVLCGVGFFIGRALAKPIVRLNSDMAAIAKNALELEITGIERTDEIGDMARSVLVFKDNAMEMKRMEEDKVEQEKNAGAEKRAAMNALADEFEGRVMVVVETVSTSSGRMQETAQSMMSTAEESNTQAATVATAAEQATSNVQTVASAAEEMSASIGEINRQVGQSTEIAAKANSDAQRTNETVQGLAEKAQKIGEVVDLITDIAEQTNLLALNATIEAARAGEAGKGFAVVASEVKNLATQTAKATEEIGTQIGDMQSVTNDAVGAIKSIGETINEISGIAEAIASSVGEQGAATQEIATSTQHAATGTREVSSTIDNVTHAASDTKSAAQEVLTGAGALSEQSETLRGEVQSFVQQIRSA